MRAAFWEEKNSWVLSNPDHLSHVSICAVSVDPDLTATMDGEMEVEWRVDEVEAATRLWGTWEAAWRGKVIGSVCLLTTWGAWKEGILVQRAHRFSVACGAKSKTQCSNETWRRSAAKKSVNCIRLFTSSSSLPLFPCIIFKYCSCTSPHLSSHSLIARWIRSSAGKFQSTWVTWAKQILLISSTCTVW